MYFKHFPIYQICMCFFFFWIYALRNSLSTFKVKNKVKGNFEFYFCIHSGILILCIYNSNIWTNHISNNFDRHSVPVGNSTCVVSIEFVSNSVIKMYVLAIVHSIRKKSQTPKTGPNIEYFTMYFKLSSYANRINIFFLSNRYILSIYYHITQCTFGVGNNARLCAARYASILHTEQRTSSTFAASADGILLYEWTALYRSHFERRSPRKHCNLCVCVSDRSTLQVQPMWCFG